MIEIQGERARRVISRAMTGTKGRFPSLKSKRTIHWESQLERDFVRSLEFEADVLSYREQPFTITFMFEGRSVRYTPDYLAERRGGIWIYEVKPADKAAQLEASGFFAAAGDAIRAQGVRYSVVTEETIRRQPRLGNIELLLRYQAVPVEGDLALAARNHIASEPSAIVELAEFLGNPQETLPQIYAMIRWGQLFADIDGQALSPTTRLAIPRRD